MDQVRGSEVQISNRPAASRWAMWTATFMVAAAVSAVGQQGGSLADAARQARAQKQAQPGTDSQAQQLADELAEDQTDNGAPGGFKTYSTGDYKVWVPAPYYVTGHDSAGVVLTGPSIGSKRPIMLLGTPIVAHFENNDDAFQETASHYSRVYAQTVSCTKGTVANHSAYQCSMAAAELLGQHVSGNAVFVKSRGTIYPVFCFAPSDSSSRDVLNNTRSGWGAKEWAKENLAREDNDAKSVFQKCETVFQSIKIPEGPSRTAESDKPGTAAGKTTASAASPAATGGPTSLAQVAQGLHQPQAQQPVISAPPAVSEAPSTIPVGYKSQPFKYCTSPTQCWDASVLVPSGAQLVSSDCQQFVFEVKVKGNPFYLMAGPGGPEGCAAQESGSSRPVKWNLLQPGQESGASVLSSLTSKVDGKTAFITQVRVRNGVSEWISKRAEIDNNGATVMVGCLAPKERFAEGDPVCSALIDSLHLP